MVDSTSWWKDLPCHYHPSWKLRNISQLDMNKLKHHIDRNENNLMVVERLLYAAFLEVPVGELYNVPLPSVTRAREYLQQAEKYVKENLKDNREASIGYGIVIYACRMWTGQSTREWEMALQNLEKDKKDYPKHEYYISAVRAFALSRLGPEWVEEARLYYEHALEGFPKNAQWLYGKASMVGRQARLKCSDAKDAGRLPEEYQALLNEERSILENVLTLKKDCHIARAMYGQVLLNLGGSEAAKREIERALKDAPGNRSIAEIASKFYQRKNDPQFGQALRILEKLPDESKTAQVNFLIGKLYRSMSFNKKKYLDKEKKWKSALLYFEKALKLDERHYPSLSSRAEMNARLKNTEKAKEQYANLLSGNLLGKLHLHQDKYKTLKTLLSLPAHIRGRILTEEEFVNYSYEVLEVLVADKSEEKNDRIFFSGDANKSVKNCVGALQEKCEGASGETEIGFLAKLKLAHFRLLCKNYEEANKIYDELKDKTSSVERENIEVMWGLFKCHLGNGKYKDATDMVEAIRQKEQMFYRIEELYADFYTARAKLQLPKQQSLNAEDVFTEEATTESEDAIELDHPPGIARLLENAIQMGSLEACFMFFKVNNLQEHFLSKSMQIPKVAAKIERVSKEEVTNTQASFPTEKYVDDETDDSTTAKRNVLKGKIEELLTYREIREEHGKYVLCGEALEELNAYQKFTVINVYAKLSKLRKHLLNFEVVAARRSKNSDWNEDCEDAVTAVLLTARFLLDHIISDYQDTLVEGEKANSDFCIHYNGKIDKDEAKKKLGNWLQCRFPESKRKHEVPKHIADMLLRVQPMYGEDNLWLIALNTFVNTLKHAGGRRKDKKPSSPTLDKGVKIPTQSNLQKDENEEVHQRETDRVDKSVRRKEKKPSTKSDKGVKEVPSYNFDLLKDGNKASLARESCQEVEKIVLEILPEIIKIYTSENQEKED